MQPIDIDEKSDFDVFLPRIGLVYDLSEFETVSFLASRGYRSGFLEIADGAVNSVDPEYLDSLELSYKAVAPDNRWTFAATAFHSTYRDQQIVILATLPDLPRTESAGKSRLYGAEFEGTYRLDNGWGLFESVGLLRTKFVDFETNAGDFSGNELPESPNLTASLGVNYRGASGFFASVTASYTGSYFSTGSIENDSALEVPSFGNVDVEVGYGPAKHIRSTAVGRHQTFFDPVANCVPRHVKQSHQIFDGMDMVFLCANAFVGTGHISAPSQPRRPYRGL